MKLAAIYNVWDGEELLKGSIDCIKDHVDLIIIVWQDVSNFFETHSPYAMILQVIKVAPCVQQFYEPTHSGGFPNEIAKRNIGLEKAQLHGCTHFLFMDCDEYWEDFGAAKAQYIDSRAEGSVAAMYTYFKKPTLRFERIDNYYVPFIHRLRSDTVAGQGHYPYYVDPTRKVNCSDVAVIGERMHHFSYVRKDIERKCRNSSARANIEKSQLLRDYNSPEVGPGFYVQDFRQQLVEVENRFNIVV